jgi:small conductance mechanosensitive channel
METVLDQLIQFSTTYGLKIIGAILILIFGRIAAGLARRIVRRLLKKASTDETITSFVTRLVFIFVMAFAVVAALAKFGVQTASFVAVLGAAGLAIGLALQGSLANFASGVMILVFRPFKVGDLINAAGVLGIVKEIRLFNTELSTLDNVKIFVPNGKIYGDVIENLPGYDIRRIDLEFGIGYSSSIQKAYDAIQAILKADSRILGEPAPQIAVAELADSSVNFVVRPWVKTGHYWDVRFDVTRKVKETFDSQGVEIPFPQLTVHKAQESV